ncbi:MAG: hypothetical protein QF824_04310 [Candidatus Woesearchaeota archaeon]|jgi:hypothetical protein|nr:hypothetical protein [Candidatus Woesearchaeota archaeon]
MVDELLSQKYARYAVANRFLEAVEGVVLCGADIEEGDLVLQVSLGHNGVYRPHAADGEHGLVGSFMAYGVVDLLEDGGVAGGIHTRNGSDRLNSGFIVPVMRGDDGIYLGPFENWSVHGSNPANRHFIGERDVYAGIYKAEFQPVEVSERYIRELLS